MRTKETSKQVLFFRRFSNFTGGHLKVWHYYNHVLATEGFDPKINMTPNSLWDERNPWFNTDCSVGEQSIENAYCLFLAGRDWEFLSLEQRKSPSMPIFNLIQHVRHADEKNPLFEFLKYPAIRITVSEEIKSAIINTGRVNGPVFHLPIGLDANELPNALPWRERCYDVVICAIKNPSLGGEVAELLKSKNITTRLLDRPLIRPEYLAELRRAKVAVTIPHLREGFYLPALEAMALNVLVVCPDCIGNRSFCIHGRTAEVPPMASDALARSAQELLGLDALSRTVRNLQSAPFVSYHNLQIERQNFQRLLNRLPQFWATVLENNSLSAE